MLISFSLITLSCKKKYETDKAKAFVKFYGGLNMDNAVDVQQTSDGGYVIAGTSNTGTSADMLIIKTNAEGNEEWHQTFGGPNYDECASVAQLPDGGYVLLGTYGKSTRKWVYNPDEIAKGELGLEVGKDTTQMYAVKLNSSGVLLWEKKYDYSNPSVKIGTFGKTIVSNPFNTDCLFAGMVDSSYGTPGSEFVNLDLFALIIDSDNGNLKQVFNTATSTIVDTKPLRYGTVDSHDITVNAISMGSNNEYQISTYTTIANDKTPRLVSCRLNGVALVQNTAPTKTDWNELEMVRAGQVAVASIPNQLLLTGYKEIGTNKNIFVMTLGGAGYSNLSIQNLGDVVSSADEGVSVTKTTDGGYAVLANTNSTTYTGSIEKLIDVLLIKVDAKGVESWNKVFGGRGDDQAVKVIQTTDGGYLICGTIGFGDNTGNPGSTNKLTLMKLDSNGDISNIKYF